MALSLLPILFHFALSSGQALLFLGQQEYRIVIKSVDLNGVSFSYNVYRQAAKTKIMQLALPDFTKRFALHILPKRVVRIRHYGFLSSTWKRLKFKDLQVSLPARKIKAAEEQNAKQHQRCTCCKKGSMHTILVFDVREPPSSYIRLLKKDPITKK